MKYKIGQHVKYNNNRNDLVHGKITKVAKGTYYIKEYYTPEAVEPGDVIGRSYKHIWQPGLMIVVALAVVGALMSPALLIDDPTPHEPTAYEDCVENVTELYDQINDTVGASYAHSDMPSANAETLIDQCLNKNN